MAAEPPWAAAALLAFLRRRCALTKSSTWGCSRCALPQFPSHPLWVRYRWHQAGPPGEGVALALAAGLAAALDLALAFAFYFLDKVE